MNYCDVCVRYFVNGHAAVQHKNALGHWSCDECDDEFWTEEHLDAHIDKEHRSPGYDCQVCSYCFSTWTDAARHMDQALHWRALWCEDCQRGFQNLNNLRMHLNSKTHRGSNIACPFCGATFTTASGVVHHLERSACPRARSLNRQTLLDLIRRRDPNHVITKKLLEYRTSDADIIATQDSWNGYCYECYICHKTFGALFSLNQHLSSGVHAQKAYCCPNRRGCGKEFGTLAGLFNHLESEACGAVRFEAMQEKVGQVFTSGRAITMGGFGGR